MLQRHRISRRTALQLTGLAGLAAVVRPRLSLAQDAELPELSFTATEYAFELSGEASAGWTRVTMVNAGAMDHHLMILRPHDGGATDAIVEALKSPDMGGIFPVAGSLGGAACGPGLSSTVVMDLPAGDYVAVCVIPDDDGVPHYIHGMYLPFSVGEGEPTGEAPAADLRIELKEMQFANLPAEVPAGAQVWEVANTGEQLHEMLLLALAEGMSIEQGMQMMGVSATPEAGMGGMGMMEEATPGMNMPMGEGTPEMMGPPPFTMLTGVAPMNPGNTNYLMADLQPGSYIALCFVPDMATGMPHFMMGMIAGFTVA